MDNFGQPYERRIVLFSDDNNFYKLRNDNEGRKFLTNSQVRVIEMDKSGNFIHEFKILGGVLPTNEMMLVLSPFDDKTYMELAEAKSLIALDKLGSTIQLSQYLGAKFVKILSINIHDRESKKTLQFDAQYKMFKGDLDIAQKDILYLSNKITLETIFEGGEPQYELAKEYLFQKRLNGDVFLSNLLEFRNPEKTKSNPIKTYKQEIFVTENLQSTFELVAKLNFPLGFFSTNYKSFVQEKTEISLMMQIDF
jgi:hypothetical protein